MVGGRTLIGSRVGFGGVIVFKSVPGSPGSTYCFCENSEFFKILKSSRKGPLTLFPGRCFWSV